MEAYDTWERPNGYKDATYLFTQNPHLFERRPAPLITDSYDCSAAKYPSGPNGVEIISLFTPRVLPWSYSKVCFLGYNGAAIGSGASTITVNVQVVMYEADPATGLPRTTPVNVQAPTTTTLSQVDSWSELSVTNLTAWSSRVFIGLRIVSQCHRAFYHTSYITRPRMSFWRPVSLAGQPSGGWSTPVLDWDTANDSHVLVRTLGQPMVPSVPGWTCSASLYNDGSTCNCECGAWDPDCKKNPVSATCGSGQVCGRSGHCLSPGWNTAVCPLASFGTGDGCHCGCGGTAIDPDCVETTENNWHPKAVNCPGVSKCNAQGACETAWTAAACTSSRYGDGVCDCECQVPGGVRDPDCWDADGPSTCGDNGTCYEGVCRPVPRGWTCSPVSWGDKLCDCNCGVFDTPGCQMPRQSYFGCVSNSLLPSTSCNLDGVCAQPLCGNGVKDEGEQCDGGIGCNSQYPGEQCDSGVGCSNCSCLAGYLQTVPPTIGCTKINYKCGDVAVQGNEECDGGKFCTVNCTCMPGHSPMSPRVPSCTGCGNSIIESGEACDSGTNCNQTECVCLAGFVPTSPVSLGCIKETQNCGNGVVQTADAQRCLTKPPLEMEAYDTWEQPAGFAGPTYLSTQNPHLFERRPAPLITDFFNCSAAKLPSGPNGVEIISLFTPRVCFLGYNGAVIGSGVYTLTVSVQVVMYEADPATGLPRTTPVNVQAPTTTTLSQVDSWSEIAVANLTAWSSRVFIGLRIVSQCHRAFYHTSYITRPRMSFWRPVSLTGQPSGGWSTPVLDWDTANDSHVLVRTLGQPMVPSVPGWTCSASLYNDGSTCNCECGAWDPDCKKNPVSATCGSGQVCGRSGHCLSPGWNTAVCPLASFGTGDGCHCGCGGTAIDPDCVETTENNWHPKAVNCPGVSKCNAQGACETAWTAAACTSSRYGDGVCDCECQEELETDLGPVIGVPVAMGFVVAGAAALAVVQIYRTRHRRMAPEISEGSLVSVPNIDMQFVPVSATSVTMGDASPIQQSPGMGPLSLTSSFHIRTTAPDGTPIIVVPVPPSPLSGGSGGLATSGGVATTTSSGSGSSGFVPVI
eukprot:m51a1_g2746 putative protein kinase domain containing protein (1079) ;mRNA; r:939398-946087